MQAIGPKVSYLIISDDVWCVSGGGDGSAGPEVSGSQQDCVLYDGGGRGGETSDRSGRGFQTMVSKVCKRKKLLHPGIEQTFDKLWEVRLCTLCVNKSCYLPK